MEGWQKYYNILQFLRIMLTLCKHIPHMILSNMSIHWMVNERMNGPPFIGKTGHQFKLKQELLYLQSFFLCSLGLKAGGGVILSIQKKLFRVHNVHYQMVFFDQALS